MFTRVWLHALRLAYGFFYSLTPLGFKGAVPSFYSSSIPVLSLTATGTTGAADTQLYGDNKNLPLPVPVNKIFVWFHFYRLPFLKQPGQLNICQLTIMCYIKKRSSAHFCLAQFIESSFRFLANSGMCAFLSG